jgi:hypothetical protein
MVGMARMRGNSVAGTLKALPATPPTSSSITVGHNLRLVFAWLRFLLRLLLIALARLFAIPIALNPAS